MGDMIVQWKHTRDLSNAKHYFVRRRDKNVIVRNVVKRFDVINR